MAKEFHSNSKVIITETGEVRLLESFSEEERAAMWDVFSERIGKCISEYVSIHPEQYKQVRDALLSVPGAELLFEETS